MKKAMAIYNRGYAKGGSKAGEEALKKAYPNITDSDIAEFYELMQKYNKRLLKGAENVRGLR